MKVLLDTHAFIWWDSDPLRLSQQSLSVCQDSENMILVSVASIWEMQIKIQLGKLKLDLPLSELIGAQQRLPQGNRRELQRLSPRLNYSTIILCSQMIFDDFR